MPPPALTSGLELTAKGAEHFRTFRRGFQGVKREAAGMNRQLAIGQRAWRGFVSFAGRVRSVLGGIWSWLKRIGIIGVGVFTGLTAGVALLARKAVMAASSLEDVWVMLRTAFGPEAERAFRAAERLSVATPFTPEAVAQGAIFLKQLKVVPSAGARLTKWMALAADMAGAMKKEFLDAVFAIGYGLQGESERLKQFGITARDLITAGAEAAKSGAGVTTQSAQAAERFLRAMERLISQRFRGGAASLARTLSGLWSTFRGIAQFLWADIAQAGGRAGLFGRIQALLRRINEALEWVRDQKAWREFTGNVSRAFGRIVEWVRKFITEENVAAWLKKAKEWAEKLEDVDLGAWFANLQERIKRAGVLGAKFAESMESASAAIRDLVDTKDSMADWAAAVKQSFKDVTADALRLLDVLGNISILAGGGMVAGGVVGKRPAVALKGMGLVAGGFAAKGVAGSQLAQMGQPPGATGRAGRLSGAAGAMGSMPGMMGYRAIVEPYLWMKQQRAVREWAAQPVIVSVDVRSTDPAEVGRAVGKHVERKMRALRAPG